MKWPTRLLDRLVGEPCTCDECEPCVADERLDVMTRRCAYVLVVLSLAYFSAQVLRAMAP